MKVLTLINEKGGVGKTTSALHLAAGLALRDRRVLLIDGSAQGHCAYLLGVPKANGLYRLLVEQADWRDVLVEPDAGHWMSIKSLDLANGRKQSDAIRPGEPKVHTPTVGRLLLLPGNLETRAIPGLVSDPLALRTRLAELAASVDVVVIDTPPEPTLAHILLYCASDGLIHPTKCEALSLDGLREASEHIYALNQARRDLGIGAARLMGVLPTMYRDTQSARHAVETLERHFGRRVWPPIPLRTVWTEREFAHQTLYAYAPDDVATAEFEAIVAKVMSYV